MRAHKPRRGVPPARMSAAPLKVVAFVTLACNWIRASTGMLRLTFYRGRRCHLLLFGCCFGLRCSCVGLRLCCPAIARQVPDNSCMHAPEVYILFGHGIELGCQIVNF